MTSPSVTLGIDLGTTSVKAALVEAAPGDPNGFVILASCTRAARAEAAAQCAAAGPQVRQRPGAAPPSRPPTSPRKTPALHQLPGCPSAAVPFPRGVDCSLTPVAPLTGLFRGDFAPGTNMLELSALGLRNPDLARLYARTFRLCAHPYHQAPSSKLRVQFVSEGSQQFPAGCRVLNRTLSAFCSLFSVLHTCSTYLEVIIHSIFRVEPRFFFFFFPLEIRGRTRPNCITLLLQGQNMN